MIFSYYGLFTGALSRALGIPLHPYKEKEPRISRITGILIHHEEPRINTSKHQIEITD